jgi:threonine dehydrogenase-like Zn-dependent dehydrogenase
LTKSRREAAAALRRALRLLKAGLVDTRSLIEARYPLDDALQAVRRAQERGALKVLLDF